ncbi:MAG: putative porin [Segetibacter sp.]
MNKQLFSTFFSSAVILLVLLSGSLNAQNSPRVFDRSGQQSQYDSSGRVRNTSSGGDSLLHRDINADSITIYYRFFDSTRIRNLDSSINDFTTRFPLPAYYVNLGNFGTAAHSLLFSPTIKPGWDPGFHAFDIYRFNMESTRFFQTTRPYTELGYMLGSKAEQMVNVVHTQNIRPNFNMAFQYRLINSPGYLQNQNTSHNSYRINGNYQSRNKRYSVYGIYVGNKLLSSESGGIQRDTLLNDYRFKERFNIATRLSGDSNLTRNPFSVRVVTGNVYNESSFLLRQQYDFGQRDSIVVNDSTTVQLFYPRFRLQHTITYSKQKYEFRDYYPGGIIKQKYYQDYFNRVLPSDTLLFRDRWLDVQNDFSIISFPEKNNLNQYVKAGFTLENLTGNFDTIQKKYHNIILNGEYRNRTRNQKWDIEGMGKFYLSGLNSGDYAFQVNLKRLLSAKLGYIEVGFQNVNRSPSFIFQPESTFKIKTVSGLNKENTTRISGSLTNTVNNFSLNGEYYLLSNYTYMDSFFRAKQEATLFNVLHVSAEKKFKLNKGLNLYSEIHFQQTTGNAPVNLPLIFTSNRLAWEGIYFKNMIYAIGFEVRYHTPYKADNYSPFNGQFFYQNTYTINNRPEVNAFFNFRIKAFKAFVRAENLNTFGFNTGKPGFTKNNLTAQHYPQQSLWIRVGVWWTFIN